MKIHINILLILFCITINVNAQKVNILSISATDDVIESQLHGFKIDAKLDKYYPAGDTSANIFVSIFKNGEAVNCNHDYSRFKNTDSGIYSYTFFNKSSISFFIPYYSLKLPPGQHNLEAKITANYSIADTSKANDQATNRENPEQYNYNGTEIDGDIECAGKNKIVFSIKQPQLYNIKVRVNELRITETPSKGGVWDTYSKPDLRFKVYMSNSWYGENIYYSPKVKNTYSAAWLDYSRTLYMTKDDVFCIYIVDKDPLFDDTIALYTFTRDSFIKTIDSKEDLTRDDVSHIIMSYEE